MSDSTLAQSSQFSSPQALLRPGLLLLAGLLLLIGAGLIWNGLQDLNAEPGGGALIEVRDRIAGKLGLRASALRKQLKGVLAEPHLQADVAAGALDEAAERIRQTWPALSHAQVFSPRLDSAVIEGETGGYGRLALVAEALVEPGIAFGVIGKGGDLSTGMAMMLNSDGRPVGVAYVELPLTGFLELVDAVDVGDGLIELRQGSQALLSKGESSLRSRAQVLKVRNTPLAVAVAVPRTALQGSPLMAIGLGAVGVVLAVLLVGALRRSQGGGGLVSSEPTFAETLAAEAPPEAAALIRQRSAEAAAEAKPAAESKPRLAVDRSAFRAYDIRGVVGKTLDDNIARLIGKAVGSALREKGLREIVVGRDGRTSGPALAAALIEGLRETGCDVIDIGQAATPVIYFASHHLHAGSCIAVTGSHNPPDYNGFKIVIDGETLSGDAIQDLYQRIAENNLQTESSGGLQTIDVSRDYIDRIASDVQLERRMRVVIDCGNGVPGAIAPEVLEAIGCDAEALYCEVDGSFPNHHPDPSDPENLRDLITSVQRTGAELGLAFDGDGDRLGVVTKSGKIIYADRVLMLFAQDVLSRNPGAAVIYDVKCTGHMSGQVLRHGGSPIMWKTGHSLIKAKMRETGAELAGEMSGHFFFKERWYGFDDGIYAAARLLEILAADERDPEEIFAELPDSVSTPELKVPMEEGDHYAFVESFRERARFEGAKIVTIDGVRADWPDGWGLVRCSNTTPSLVMRFDADSEPALARIQESFRAQILAVRPELKLPF